MLAPNLMGSVYIDIRLPLSQSIGGDNPESQSWNGPSRNHTPVPICSDARDVLYKREGSNGASHLITDLRKSA